VRLLEVGIQNYKSLRNVTLKPGPLSVFIGPNGAGKSNLCDVLAFISDLHRGGLGHALANHGGYHAVKSQSANRFFEPISLQIKASLDTREFHHSQNGDTQSNRVQNVVVDHIVTIGLLEAPSPSEPYILSESINCTIRLDGDDQNLRTLEILRYLNRIISISLTDLPDYLLPMKGISEHTMRSVLEASIGSSRSPLLSEAVETFLLPFVPINSSIGSMGLYELMPAMLRAPSLADGGTELDRHGGNLPAAVQWLKRHHLREFHGALNAVRLIMPNLEDVNVFTTPQKTLQLTFKERGFSRPWTAGEVSDGTIRGLGLLTAVFEPRSKVVVVEEPENSLHPWAIGEFVDAGREIAEHKQIVLTTYSPSLINHLHPRDLWVVSKKTGDTQIVKLDELDPDATIGWEDGRFTLSQYLESGIVREAVPSLT
jgi:predicted ATPase